MTKIIDFQAAARRASDETLMETINRIIARRLAETAEPFPETPRQRVPAGRSATPTGSMNKAQNEQAARSAADCGPSTPAEAVTDC
jgi:hypothetical protein